MAIDRQAVADAYPQYLWALDNPDVAGVMEKALAEGWDQGRIVAGLQGTNWWKTTQPSVRVWQEKLATDPEGVNQSIRERDAKLWDQAQSLGLNLSAAAVDEIARTSLQLGWNDSQMLDTLVETSRKQGYQGTQNSLGGIQSTIDSLKAGATQYLVDVDDNTAYNWAMQVAAGEKKPEDFLSLFKDWSKARFSYDPALVQRIDAGFAPADLFRPQRKRIADLLEVDENTVNLNDPKWSQVLDYPDPKTNARRAMTEPEAARLARSQAEWKKTENGKAAGSTFLGNIREMFEGAR